MKSRECGRCGDRAYIFEAPKNKRRQWMATRSYCPNCCQFGVMDMTCGDWMAETSGVPLWIREKACLAIKEKYRLLSERMELKLRTPNESMGNNSRLTQGQPSPKDR